MERIKYADAVVILPLTLRLGLWQALLDDLPLRETTHARRRRGAPQRFSARLCLKCNKGRRQQLMGLISWPAVSNYHVISCAHQPTPHLIWRRSQSRYFEAVGSFCATKSLNNKRGGVLCVWFLCLNVFKRNLDITVSRIRAQQRKPR